MKKFALLAAVVAAVFGASCQQTQPAPTPAPMVYPSK
jgi:nitrous oxide reductase accessory protein NosL